MEDFGKWMFLSIGLIVAVFLFVNGHAAFAEKVLFALVFIAFLL